jgi:hypothetical protein
LNEFMVKERCFACRISNLCSRGDLEELKFFKFNHRNTVNWIVHSPRSVVLVVKKRTAIYATASCGKMYGGGLLRQFLFMDATGDDACILLPEPVSWGFYISLLRQGSTLHCGHVSDPISSGLDLLLQRFTIHARVPVLLEVGPEARILTLELALPVRNHKVRNGAPDHGKGRADEEYTLNALLGVAKGVLDRREDLRTDGGTGLADGGGESEEVAAERRREGLGSAQEGGNLFHVGSATVLKTLFERERQRTYTGTHLAKALEDAVENNKEGENTLDRLKSATDNEAQDTPEQETKSHGLLAADAVHQETADQRARKVEAVDNGSEPNVLDQAVVGLESPDNGGAEDAKGVCL